MSLDGILFYKLANELNNLSTGKIMKIQEVSDDEFLFTIRRERENYKLLISLSSNYPRINLTDKSYSFPREPKPFTMLLRKHFEGAIINSITTHSTDRIMTIRTSRYNELGDFEIKDLVVEIMGRYSNLILVENNKVIDAIRHIGVSDMRSIMPNSSYEFPDAFNKINPFLYNLDELRNELKDVENPSNLAKKVMGLSKGNAEICFDSNDFVESLYNMIHNSIPFLEIEPKRDINYTKVGKGEEYDSYSSLFESYYSEQSLKERIKSKTNNILSYVKKLIKKNEDKLVKLTKELDDTKKAETYKLYGELLIANSYINEKMDKIELLNYYTNEMITIPLDKKLYIKENANLYFKKYRKSKNTKIYALKEIEIAKDEIEYFKILESQINNAEVLDDVLQIQDELIKEKYLIPQHKQQKLQKPQILTYELDSHLIYVGKNNMQNEIVTFDLSRKDDLWFHVKDAPGSHVLLKKSDNYTEDDIRTCANLAAYYSTYQNSSSVAVNYTKVKNIKSIPGKRKCFVSIKDEKTIYIDPNFKLISNLKKMK